MADAKAHAAPASGARLGGALLPIAANTFTEAVRQPIHAILLLLGIGLQALNPMVAAYTLGDDDLLLLELGLSTIFLLGMFLAAFTASLALGDEIRRQTVLTVLAKPVSRDTLLLGKFLGIAGALAVAWLVWGLALLLALRHSVPMRATDPGDGPVLAFAGGGLLLALALAFWANWRHRRSFPARLGLHLAWISVVATGLALSFDKTWAWQGPLVDLDGNVLAALLLLLEGMLLLGAVALAASTRLPTMATLAVTSAVFAVGMVGEALLGDSPLRFALPNLQLLWVSEGLLRGEDLTMGTLGWVSAWALVYTAAVLAVASALFRGRDVS